MKRMLSRLFSRDVAVLLADVPKRTIALVVVLGAVGGVAEAALLILLIRTIGVATGGGGGLNVSNVLGFISLPSDLTFNIGFGVAAGVVCIVVQIVTVRLLANLASEKLTERRRELIHAFYASPISIQRDESSGHLQELLSQNVTRMSEGILMAGQGVAAWANLAVLLVAAVAVNPLAAGAIIVLGAVLGLALTPLTGAVGRHSREWAVRGAEYANTVSVFSRLFVELRVFGVAGPVEGRLNASAEGVAAAWRRNRVLQRSTPIVYRNVTLTIGLVVIGLVALFAASALGSIAAIALLLIRALTYLQTIQQNNQMLKEMAAFAKTVRESIARFHPDTTVWGTTSLGSFETYTLAEVDYSWGGDQMHLSQLNIRLKRGELTAITGSSGSGKSTLLQVLLRLVQPTAGHAYVDSTSVSELTEESWHRLVAYMPQEVRLIPGTLGDNVRFYRAASDEAVTESLRLAALELHGNAFPDGVNTQIAEEGKNLSGGQRQRIGLARAILGQPAMLVLDEPTSALDHESESSVLSTIFDLSRARVVVMVTHRKDAAARSDAVYEMRAGRLQPATPFKS